MLRYHPANVVCPESIRQAEWERRMKQPQGYPVTAGGEPEAFVEAERIPYGIRCHNAWRKPKSGGRGPSLERLLKHLLSRFGGLDPEAERIVDLLAFLKKGSFLTPVELYGARDKAKLLQLNEEVVRLQLVTEDIRMHCEVCSAVLSGAAAGMPCPKCHGTLVRWLDREVNASRSVKRIKKPHTIPLVAKEHTAQITTDDRHRLRDRLQGPGRRVQGQRAGLLADAGDGHRRGRFGCRGDAEHPAPAGQLRPARRACRAALAGRPGAGLRPQHAPRPVFL